MFFLTDKDFMLQTTTTWTCTRTSSYLSHMSTLSVFFRYDFINNIFFLQKSKSKGFFGKNIVFQMTIAAYLIIFCLTTGHDLFKLFNFDDLHSRSRWMMCYRRLRPWHPSRRRTVPTSRTCGSNWASASTKSSSWWKRSETEFQRRWPYLLPCHMELASVTDLRERIYFAA